MTENQRIRAILTNAIIWAAMMIATALMVVDLAVHQKSTLMFLQIVGWLTVDQFLHKGRRIKEELACLRNFITRKK